MNWPWPPLPLNCFHKHALVLWVTSLTNLVLSIRNLHIKALCFERVKSGASIKVAENISLRGLKIIKLNTSKLVSKGWEIGRDFFGKPPALKSYCSRKDGFEKDRQSWRLSGESGGKILKDLLVWLNIYRQIFKLQPICKLNAYFGEQRNS